MKIISKRSFTEKTTVVDIQVNDKHCFAIGKSKIIAHNSYIRPRGSFIKGVGVESPGAVKFMELFDKSSEIITAGSGTKSTNKKAKGKIRKGAQMGILNVWHPDIVEFITAKQTPGKLTKFNMSVNCSDDFMNKLDMIAKLKADNASQEEIDEVDIWDLKFPNTDHPDYKNKWTGDIKLWEQQGYPVNIFQTIKVTSLWDLIMKSTYNRSEPGIVFLDRANYYNPLAYKESIVATNPCAEQTLPPGGCCDLGSVNLTQFINDDLNDFNYEKLKKYIKYLVRFLDNVNTYSNAPLTEYKENMIKKRRIGCGIMGWGSSLLMMKIRFGSDDAQNIRDKLMKFFSHSVYESSIDLAVEKGMFELCDPEQHANAPFLTQIELPVELIEKIRKYGIRNSALLSCQPTGNSSIYSNIVSGGIEPIFLPEYIRTIIVNSMPLHLKTKCPKWYEGEFHETEMFKFVKEGDEEILKGIDEYGVTYKIDKNRGLTKEVLCEDYGVRFLKMREHWNPNAEYVATTEQLTIQEHINDLRGFAKYMDSSISKTINLPNDIDYEDFKQVYLNAYNTGYIKGVTTYRAGTMASVLSKVSEKITDEEEIILTDVKMPENAPSSMKTLKAEGKKWYLNVVYYESNKRPFALFASTNHSERNIQTMGAVERLLNLAARKGIPQVHIDKLLEKTKGDNNVDKICRAISLNLRHGVLIRNIVGELNKIDMNFASFLFQVKKFLASYIKDGEKVEGAKCENCGSTNIVFSEGCHKCGDCGASKCS